MTHHPFRNFITVTGASVAAIVLAMVSIRPITAQETTTTNPADNAELAQMYTEDQSDRTPPDGAPIDWAAVHTRDRAREVRAKELYRENKLHTGADYYCAAMILQHCATPEDYLLAHELCVVALSLGEDRAKWLAAASEDRFLMSIDRPQRFGTQYRSDSVVASIKLYRYDESVTDALRAMMDVPSIDAAIAQEAAMNED